MITDKRMVELSRNFSLGRDGIFGAIWIQIHILEFVFTCRGKDNYGNCHYGITADISVHGKPLWRFSLSEFFLVYNVYII